MSDYRPPISSFHATWELPEGYYVGSIQFRRWHGHSPITVYLCYEAKEIIEERSFLISAGYTGDGDNFPAALAVAKEKVDKALEEERAKRVDFVRNPPKVGGIKPAQPKPAGPLPDITGLKFDL